MPDRFGAYEILYELKSGGMGAVLLGRRRGIGAFEQLVAIKTIRREHAATPSVRAMFLDEAALLARLVHPAVANVHDFGEHDNTLYMVMEYVAGIPFRDLVELRPPPTIAARAIAEACRGLHAAHELRDLHGNLLGVVHRDISPDNLMLGFDGHVKVIDFGIALVKNRSAPVTEFGTVKGKPPYMSPEQVKNQPIDRRSDVFSLAVVLHELLVGRPLFDGDSVYAIALAISEQDIAPPSRLLPAGVVPPGLDAAVLAALARDREQRTPTVAALAEQLEQVVQAAGGESLEAWAERELEPRRDAHREWLARIVSGRASASVRAIGRPTDELTERNEAQAAPPATSGDIGSVETQLAHRRRGVRAAAIALAVMTVVAGLGVGLYVALGRGDDAGKKVAVAAHPDARAIAPLAVADARVQAFTDPIDAATEPPPPPIDAGLPPRHRADAGRTVRVPRDAAPLVRDVDAAVTAPAGTGFANISSKPGGHYLDVVIDGKKAGVTPMLHRALPAGRHTFQLLAPDTGAVLVEETVTVVDGQTVNIQQR